VRGTVYLGVFDSSYFKINNENNYYVQCKYEYDLHKVQY